MSARRANLKTSLGLLVLALGMAGYFTGWPLAKTWGLMHQGEFGRLEVLALLDTDPSPHEGNYHTYRYRLRVAGYEFTRTGAQRYEVGGYYTAWYLGTDPERFAVADKDDGLLTVFLREANVGWVISSLIAAGVLAGLGISFLRLALRNSPLDRPGPLPLP